MDERSPFLKHFPGAASLEPGTLDFREFIGRKFAVATAPQLVIKKTLDAIRNQPPVKSSRYRWQDASDTKCFRAHQQLFETVHVR